MLNDVRITIFDPIFGSVLARDVSNRTTAVTYENAPDGCRGATVGTDLLWEEVFDRGIYQGRNGIEISTGDDLLNLDFTGPRADGTSRLYVTSTAPYDVGKTGCNGQVYLWDGGILTMGIPVIGVGVEPNGQPYIDVGPPAAWPGNPTKIPAYAASATIVGRRVYAGRIAGRDRSNTRDKKMIYSCVGMTSRLNERNITYTFNVYDIGASIYHCIQQITWGDLYVDPANFPVVGQTYSGTGTNSAVLSAITGALAANSTGDVWVVRVGHDRAPRLLNLYRGASNTYTVTTTFDQSSARLGATSVTSRDEDTSKMFNSVLVNGDTDQVSGQPYGAIAQDALSITTYGQIDAPPVSNTSLKSNTACYALAKTLLNEQAIPVASNSCVIYARSDGPVGDLNSQTGLANGDRVYGIECVQIVGFEGNNTPILFGIPMSVVTTIPRASSGERMQTITFKAVEPDWNAEVRERVNGAKFAVIANTQTPANLGQYCVSAEAFPPTYARLNFSPPLFLAQFAVGTQVVPVGNNGPIQVIASSTNYAWIDSGNNWTIKQDPSPVPGAILYGFFSADVSHIVGFFARAPVGTFKIGVGNINNGHQTAPTFGKPGVVTAAPSFSTVDSDVSLQVWPNNVPQDGSVAGLAFFFRKGGSTPGPWVPYDEVTLNPPVPAVFPTTGSGISFTMGQLLNSQTYDFACCYAGMQGYGSLSIITTGYVAVNMAINTNYLLNTTTLPAFSGTPVINQSTASAISSTVQINFNFSNQPSNGDTAKVNTFYRVVGDFYWSFYGTLPVIQYGGTYVAKFQDLTNGVAYEFGTSLESTGRAESSVVSLGTYTTANLNVVAPLDLKMPGSLFTYGPNITSLTYAAIRNNGGPVALQDITLVVPVADKAQNGGTWFHQYLAYARDTTTQKVLGQPTPWIESTTTPGTYTATIAIPANTRINTGLALRDLAGQLSHVAWDGTEAYASPVTTIALNKTVIAPIINSPVYSQSAVSTISSTVMIQFPIDNMPTDNTVSKVILWYRKSGDFYPSFYGTLPVLPFGQTYVARYADLTNGVTYNFGVSLETTSGLESAILWGVDYTTTTLVIVAAADLAMPGTMFTYGPNVTSFTRIGSIRAGSGVALQDIQYVVPVADRNSGSAAWFDSYDVYLRDANTNALIGGAPTILTQTATAGTYTGTISIPAGLSVSTGLALRDNSGQISHIAWDGSSTTATGVGSPFILGGTSAPAPIIASSPAPTFTPSASANGLNAAETVGFTLSNQPTDGSLHSIAIFYKDVNATGWSYYGSVDAVGVGSTTPPSSAAYSIILLMLNAGITYQFGCRYVSVNGSTTSYTTAIGTMSGPATVSVPLGGSTGTVPYGNNTGSVTNVITNTGAFGTGAYQNSSGAFPTSTGATTPNNGNASIALPAGTWFCRCDWQFVGNNASSSIGNGAGFSNFISSTDSANDQASSLACLATGTVTGQQTVNFNLSVVYSGAGTFRYVQGVWVITAFRIA